MKTQIKRCLVMLVVLLGIVSVADAELISRLATKCLGQTQDTLIHLMLLIALIAILIASLITAVFLGMATRWIVGFEIPYWYAYRMAIILHVIAFLTSLPILFIDAPAFTAAVLLGIVEFPIVSAIYGFMIKDPDLGEPIGFANGMLILLCVIVIEFVIALIIGFLTLIVLGLMRSYNLV